MPFRMGAMPSLLLTALLALAGPVGWAIGGTAVVGAGLFTRSKNGKVADQGQRFAIHYVDPAGPAAKAGLSPGAQLSHDDAHTLAVAEPFQAVSITDLADPLKNVYEWQAGLVPRRSFPTHPTQIYSSLNAFLLCGFVLAISPFVKRDGALCCMMPALPLAHRTP